jgi:SAM-dependent methyltransferase
LLRLSPPRLRRFSTSFGLTWLDAAGPTAPPAPRPPSGRFRRIGVAGKRVYDLGCGYGRVLLIARRLGAVPIGVELDPLRWLICKLRCRCRVIYGDMFKTPLSDADVVYIFQWPSVNAKLAEKLRKELRAWHVRRLVYVGGAGLRLVAHERSLRVYIYETCPPSC